MSEHNQEMQNFQKWYSPAETIDKATDFFSTADIVDAIRQLDPSSKINPEDIFKLLTDEGYTYAPDPGKLTFQLRWMLIRNF